LTLYLIGILHLFPAQAQETLTTPVARGETPRDHAAPDPYFPNCFYDCFVNHAFVWKSGATVDLGTLPGGASSFAYSIYNSGVIVGQSQNGSFDPFTGYPEARGVIWRKGQIIDLGTLGGTQSNADALNDSGRVVGGALTAIPDPFANAPLGACMVLPSTLSCSGFSFAVNALYFPASTETHAFLWHDGLIRDLGTLGGLPVLLIPCDDNHPNIEGCDYSLNE
jgi:hypothetical protein